MYLGTLACLTKGLRVFRKILRQPVGRNIQFACQVVSEVRSASLAVERAKSGVDVVQVH